VSHRGVYPRRLRHLSRDALRRQRRNRRRPNELATPAAKRLILYRLTLTVRRRTQPAPLPARVLLDFAVSLRSLSVILVSFGEKAEESGQSISNIPDGFAERLPEIRSTRCPGGQVNFPTSKPCKAVAPDDRLDRTARRPLLGRMANTTERSVEVRRRALRQPRVSTKSSARLVLDLQFIGPHTPILAWCIGSGRARRHVIADLSEALPSISGEAWASF